MKIHKLHFLFHKLSRNTFVIHVSVPGLRYTFHKSYPGCHCEDVLWGKELGCFERKYCTAYQEERADQTGNKKEKCLLIEITWRGKRLFWKWKYKQVLYLNFHTCSILDITLHTYLILSVYNIWQKFFFYVLV